MLKINELPDIGDAKDPQDILDSCINCGCCNEICPTFTVLNDENDGPRGRINLMRGLFGNEDAPDDHTVKHLDRCLSCTACQTVCPVGVDYMHLIDAARVEIAEKYVRPKRDASLRDLLADVLPDPDKFRSEMQRASKYKFIAGVASAVPGLRSYGALLEAVPDSVPNLKTELAAGHYEATGASQGKVMIPSGCVQKVLDSDINKAAIALLNAAGVDVTVPGNDNCCGAISLHLGKEDQALQMARSNIDAWYPLIEDGLDAIVITTSGCGTTIKDYGSLLAKDPDYAQKAAAISALALDITEYLVKITMPEPVAQPDLTVAYHAACSMQHTQGVKFEPRRLLIDAGCKLTRPSNESMCCGSAGTYSFTQPEIAGELGSRKAKSLTEAKPDVIVGGNLGCLSHIAKSTDVPLIHTVQLLAWIYTGTKPKALG
ncbi:glycolate oxidase subunit GlcF [Octadecabacter sp.]|nr:glycolate oxidase subunit GlcF [Octadecabacter sp.]